MSILATIGSFLFGSSSGTSVVGKSLELADQYIEDKDKKNELAVRLIESAQKADSVQTVPWVDAVHKMGRQLLWFTVIGVYMYCKIKSIPIDISEIALLCAGPGAYTLMKGKGA